MPPPNTGQWIAQQEEDGNIQFVYHLQNSETGEATLYKNETTEQLRLLGHNQRIPHDSKEVRIIRTIGPRRNVLDHNPSDEIEPEDSLWLYHYIR